MRSRLQIRHGDTPSQFGDRAFRPLAHRKAGRKLPPHRLLGISDQKMPQ
jgi:hypothetical protein